jgi:pre-mRNA-splicing factor ATP-dependent RNA helicase DHX16
MSHSNNTTKKYEGPEEETKMTIGGSSRKSIEMWCSDKLHDILGYSDSALASYLTHVASTSKSSQEVVEVLQQGGVSSVTDDSVKSFAHDLFLRAQQQQQKLKKRDTKTTAKKEQKQYSLVSLLESTNTNNVEETNTMAANSSQKKMNEKKLKKVRHRRSYQVDDDSNSSTSTASSSPPKEQIPSSRSTMKDDDDDSFNNTTAASVEINSSSTSAFTEKELEEIRRQQDLQERDEFAKRLLHKDKEKTKQKIAQEEEHEEEQKQKENKRLSEADDADIIEKLREKSRRTYLKKREERELTLLEQSLKDEEELFASEKMTKEERKRIELQKQILQMAKKRRRSEEEGQAGEEEDDENKVYRLPDEENDRRTASKADQDSKLLMARYVEGKHEKTEQELWEESQTKKGGISSSKRKNNKNILLEQQEYDYVFDEDYQIDFVMGHDGIKGYDNRRKDTKMETVSEIPTTSTIVKPMTEYQRLQESRKQLPVYAYRDEFLAALRDHQGTLFLDLSKCMGIHSTVHFYLIYTNLLYTLKC